MEFLLEPQEVREVLDQPLPPRYGNLVPDMVSFSSRLTHPSCAPRCQAYPPGSQPLSSNCTTQRIMCLPLTKIILTSRTPWFLGFKLSRIPKGNREGQGFLGILASSCFLQSSSPHGPQTIAFRNLAPSLFLINKVLLTHSHALIATVGLQ